MAATNPDRASYFPAIEKKYGLPMAYWHERMVEIAGQKYPAPVQPTSSQRFDTLDEYLAQFDETKRKTVTDVFAAITSKFPKLETVIAWNQPMLKLGTQYIFGATVLKNHILLAPWSKDVLEAFAERLSGYEVNKKTFKIPVDWKVDKKLLRDIAAARISEL
ncbi:MAG: hypothetical protein NTW81_06520 [Actinobacteria bacterium]|nr:hypothetical protein [Actinomycetota bacterium]